MSKPKPIKQLFLSHPFGGKRANAYAALMWAADLTDALDGALVVAPWVPFCLHWRDSCEFRTRGLDLSLASIDHCDGLIAIRPSESAGGRLEMARDIELGRNPFVIEMDRFKFLSSKAEVAKLAAHFGVGVFGGHNGD